MLISVVISTWNRSDILSRVLNAINLQDISKNKYEVIVVDSSSPDDTEELVLRSAANYSYFLSYLNIETNTASAKRNAGLKFARGKFVIFLDDDCIPDRTHFRESVRTAFKVRNDKAVLCGGVYFNRDLVKSSNYYRYRDSCHYNKYNDICCHQLKFYQIVTMNMVVRKRDVIKNSLYFDESFVGYGCEDIYYGFTVCSAGFKILPYSANIEHIEPLGNLKNFGIKIHRASRDGARTLLQKNAKLLDYLSNSKLIENVEPNESLRLRLMKRALHWALNPTINRLMVFFVTATDQLPLFYSRTIFRFALAGFARKGVKDRDISCKLSVDKVNVAGWYE